MRLRSGERVTVVDGHDRREPLVRRVVRVSGGMPSEPQFTVSRTPGEQLIVSGALSHELVSVRFRPSGPARVERAVALTFDDGPSAQYTPRILAALTKLRVRATFFLIGYLAEANPDLVRQVPVVVGQSVLAVAGNVEIPEHRLIEWWTTERNKARAIGDVQLALENGQFKFDHDTNPQLAKALRGYQVPRYLCGAGLHHEPSRHARVRWIGLRETQPRARRLQRLKAEAARRRLPNAGVLRCVPGVFPQAPRATSEDCVPQSSQ
jgi:hypothetical protein